MAIGSFFASSAMIVGALLAASTALLVVFLMKSTPQYLKSQELHMATRVYGLVGNFFIVLFQIAIVGVRIAQLGQVV